MTKEEKKAAAIAAAEAAKKAAEEAAKADNGSDDWDAPPAHGAAAAPESEFDAPVEVRCIVDTRPFTHKKALNNGETAMVPSHVAELMLKRKQVELV